MRNHRASDVLAEGESLPLSIGSSVDSRDEADIAGLMPSSPTVEPQHAEPAPTLAELGEACEATQGSSQTNSMAEAQACENAPSHQATAMDAQPQKEVAHANNATDGDDAPAALPASEDSVDVGSMAADHPRLPSCQDEKHIHEVPAARDHRMEVSRARSAVLATTELAALAKGQREKAAHKSSADADAPARKADGHEAPVASAAEPASSPAASLALEHPDEPQVARTLPSLQDPGGIASTADADTDPAPLPPHSREPILAAVSNADLLDDEQAHPASQPEGISGAAASGKPLQLGEEMVPATQAHDDSSPLEEATLTPLPSQNGVDPDTVQPLQYGEPAIGAEPAADGSDSAQIVAAPVHSGDPREAASAHQLQLHITQPASEPIAETNQSLSIAGGIEPVPASVQTWQPTSAARGADEDDEMDGWTSGSQLALDMVPEPAAGSSTSMGYDGCYSLLEAARLGELPLSEDRHAFSEQHGAANLQALPPEVAAGDVEMSDAWRDGVVQDVSGEGAGAVQQEPMDMEASAAALQGMHPLMHWGQAASSQGSSAQQVHPAHTGSTVAPNFAMQSGQAAYNGASPTEHAQPPQRQSDALSGPRAASPSDTTMMDSTAAQDMSEPQAPILSKARESLPSNSQQQVDAAMADALSTALMGAASPSSPATQNNAPLIPQTPVLLSRVPSASAFQQSNPLQPSQMIRPGPAAGNQSDSSSPAATEPSAAGTPTAGPGTPTQLVPMLQAPDDEFAAAASPLRHRSSIAGSAAFGHPLGAHPPQSLDSTPLGSPQEGLCSPSPSWSAVQQAGSFHPQRRSSQGSPHLQQAPAGSAAGNPNLTADSHPPPTWSGACAAAERSLTEPLQSPPPHLQQVSRNGSGKGSDLVRSADFSEHQSSREEKSSAASAPSADAPPLAVQPLTRRSPLSFTRRSPTSSRTVTHATEGLELPTRKVHHATEGAPRSAPETQGAIAQSPPEGKSGPGKRQRDLQDGVPGVPGPTGGSSQDGPSLSLDRKGSYGDTGHLVAAASASKRARTESPRKAAPVLRRMCPPPQPFPGQPCTLKASLELHDTIC